MEEVGVSNTTQDPNTGGFSWWESIKKGLEIVQQILTRKTTANPNGTDTTTEPDTTLNPDTTKAKSNNWVVWVIGGVTAVAIIGVGVYFYNKKKKTTQPKALKT